MKITDGSIVDKLNKTTENLVSNILAGKNLPSTQSASVQSNLATLQTISIDVLTKLQQVSDEHTTLETMGNALEATQQLAAEDPVNYGSILGKQLHALIDEIHARHDKYTALFGAAGASPYNLLNTICIGHTEEIQKQLQIISRAEMQLEATARAELEHEALFERLDSQPSYTAGEKRLAQSTAELQEARRQAAFAQTMKQAAEIAIVNAIHRISGEDSILLDGIVKTRKSLGDALRLYRSIPEQLSLYSRDYNTKIVTSITSARNILGLS